MRIANRLLPKILRVNFVAVCLHVGIQRWVFPDTAVCILLYITVWGTRCSVLIHLRGPLRLCVVRVVGYIYRYIRDSTADSGDG